MLPIFPFLQEEGDVEEWEMYRVFNMGIGLVLVVSPNQHDVAIDILKEAGETPFQIGEIVSGERGVRIV